MGKCVLPGSARMLGRGTTLTSHTPATRADARADARKTALHCAPFLLGLSGETTVQPAPRLPPDSSSAPSSSWPIGQLLLLPVLSPQLPRLEAAGTRLEYLPANGTSAAAPPLLFPWAPPPLLSSLGDITPARLTRAPQQEAQAQLNPHPTCGSGFPCKWSLAALGKAAPAAGVGPHNSFSIYPAVPLRHPFSPETLHSHVGPPPSSFLGSIASALYG
jgi:hypothetical protein